MPTDFVKKADRLKVSEVTFCLHPPSWTAFTCQFALKWNSVPFAASSRQDVPTTRGLYAFVVMPALKQVFSHGYVFYVGQTGHNSNHTLRKRFGDYLQNVANIRNRHAIHYMLNKWRTHLHFFYTEVPNTNISLLRLEARLNDALLPPFSTGDFSAEVKAQRKALR